MINIPAPKRVAIILFYDKKGNILLQNRKKISKWGEEYGLFGGTVESGETPEECLKRELLEELGLIDTKFRQFKVDNQKNEEMGITIERNIYLAEIPEITNLVCYEGEFELRTFEDSMELKFVPGSGILLKEIYDHLKSIKEIIQKES